VRPKRVTGPVEVPITYEAQPHDRIVVATLGGTLAVEDYAATLREALADARYEPGSALLLDAQRLEKLPSVAELRELVHLARELSAHDVQPFAIVTANDHQYLAARLFATLAGATINLETRVFRTPHVARQWLRTARAARQRAAPVDADRSGSGSAPVAS
jgi:hypothetical protein